MGGFKDFFNDDLAFILFLILILLILGDVD